MPQDLLNLSVGQVAWRSMFCGGFLSVYESARLVSIGWNLTRQ